jgi:hypothetical protein
MHLNIGGKNLVLGLASGYEFTILRPLISTLKATEFQGDIVFFISNLSKSTIKSLERENVQLVQYKDSYPYFENDDTLQEYISPELNGKYLSPNSLRYVFYRAFLRKNALKYNWILHTDTRDVIFQKDPFLYYKEPGLYCFLEDLSFRIKDNKYNSYWIKFGFGDEMFGQMANEPISCSGVTLGTTDAFLDYLDKMVDNIVRLPNTGGLDQGIHNYLIFTSQVEQLHLIKDDDGPVTTLTTFKPFDGIKFNNKGLLLNNHNQVLPIVHQYDRHMRLLWRFNKYAFFEKAKNLAKRRILIALGRKLDE